MQCIRLSQLYTFILNGYEFMTSYDTFILNGYDFIYQTTALTSRFPYHYYRYYVLSMYDAITAVN